jgi:hypothetical protein
VILLIIGAISIYKGGWLNKNAIYGLKFRLILAGTIAIIVGLVLLFYKAE